MGLKHQSIATISSPQFINLEPLDINPLMSFCDIKVLYLGCNRNQSYITKEVATEMAKTLRGAPIVGYYKKDKQDFGDHGEQVILDDEGFHFNCLTKPYGFVAPDAKVWFQDFEDYDDFGNTQVRTYLMTNGYLWTGQFKEAQQVIDGGKPQSMELDEKSLQGNWSTNIKQDMDFFIINDAIFSKLCILGDDVEPCFEGASITKNDEAKTSFTLDNNFKKTLFKMMQELEDALKGGSSVVKAAENQQENEQEGKTTDFALENDEVTPNEEPQPAEETQQNEVQPEQNVEFTQEEEETNEIPQEEQGTEENESTVEFTQEDYSLLQQKYDELQTSFTAMEKEVNELREFKTTIENQEKDNLIQQFYMLSEEDKKDVIENKANYSLDEIKAKLSVICFEKKVNFGLDDSSKNEEQTEDKPVLVFNVESNKEDSTPDWVKKVELAMRNTL